MWLGRGWLEASWPLEMQSEHQCQVVLGSPACLVHDRLPSLSNTCPWFSLPCPEQRDALMPWGQAGLLWYLQLWALL